MVGGVDDAVASFPGQPRQPGVPVPVGLTARLAPNLAEPWSSERRGRRRRSLNDQPMVVRG